jgi:hypothetical protein
VEVAFFDRKSRSLLVTDAVIFVPEKPPKVVPPELLIASAQNGLAVRLLSAGKEVPDEPVLDTPANRQKGSCLLISSYSYLLKGTLYTL